MTTSSRIKVKLSGGNVFADLGLNNPEERLAKAQLAVRIAAAIKARKLTQLTAAEVCGIDQPKISKLMRGDLYGFSTDQLFRFLTALGQDVEIIVRDRPRRRGSVKGKLTVRAA
jgi:predicted XRE-type DNA-binding protein